MTESPLDWAESTDDDEPNDRRRQLMIVGGIVGAAVVAGGAFLLLHGGGSSSSDNGGLVAGAHHPAAAAPVAAAPSKEPVVTTFHGAVGHDPFEVPDRVAAALAPPPAAAPASTATSTTVKGPSSTGIGTITIPTGSGSTPVGTLPVTTPTRTPVQWLQLLAAHKVGSHWTVDVRTNYGTFKGVKEGATKVGKTYFSFLGEDGSLGTPTFVFIVGDSSGGNIVPNAGVKPYKGVLLPSALTSTLVLRNGIVDGGVS